VDWRNKASETSIIQQGLELPSKPITSTETLRVQRDFAVYSSCQSFLCTALLARFSVNTQVFSFRVPFKGTSFLTARRNIVPRAVYVIAQIPGGRTGGRADGRADGRTETKLSSSNSTKTVRDRRLVSMEH
jgi:hypothetical protein